MANVATMEEQGEAGFFAPERQGGLAPEGRDGRPPAPDAGRGRAPPVPHVGPAGKPRLARAAKALLALLAEEAARGSAFLWAPVLVAAGAAAYFALPFEPGLTACAVAAALPLAAAAGLRPGAVRVAALALFLLFAGSFLAALETFRADTKMLGAEISTAITGRVVAIENQASGRVRITIDVIDTARPQLRYAPDRIRITAREAPAGLVAGEGISGYARLLPPSGPVRPHSYDFAFESYFAGIGATGFFLGNPRRAGIAPQEDWVSRIGRAVEGVRSRIAGRVTERIGGAEGEVAAALIAGVRAGIPEPVNEALRRTGLAHVLSISGLHMALVAGTVMVSLRAGFALFPTFSSRRPVKKYAAIGALVAIAYYLAVSGAAVAAQRSCIMIAVMLVALLFDRAALTMRNLAIAALIVLALSPHEIAGPSFQMSFAATAALIAAYGAWSAWRQGRASAHAPDASPGARAARVALIYFAGLAATSVIAGLATTIYGAWHFNRVAPLGLFANLAAMPVVSAVVMPSAVAAVLLMPFGLDGVPLDLMGWGIARMIAVATYLSERSPVDAVGAIPLAALLLLTGALVLAAASTTMLRLASIPLAIVGLAALFARDLPDVLVAEEGDLVAIAEAGGALHVSRTRPNGFTLRNWTAAMRAGRVSTPTMLEEGQDLFSALEGPGFFCSGDLCAARHVGGSVVAVARSVDAARRACGRASVLVVDEAGGGDPCGPETTVLSRKDRARKGSAAVWLGAPGPTSRPVVVQAIGEPFRPWHAHRAYSRAARDLPPWQPRADRGPRTPVMGPANATARD